VDYLYSLYDALVSINFPNDKATKQDLQLIRQEIENRQALTARDIASMRRDLSGEIGALRGDMARGAETLRLRLTVQLGAMFMVGMGLLFAALKLT
jgi:hypothetical protein